MWTECHHGQISLVTAAWVTNAAQHAINRLVEAAETRINITDHATLLYRHACWSLNWQHWPLVVKVDLDYAEADRTVFLEGEGIETPWKALQLQKHYSDHKADPKQFTNRLNGSRQIFEEILVIPLKDLLKDDFLKGKWSAISLLAESAAEIAAVHSRVLKAFEQLPDGNYMYSWFRDSFNPVQAHISDALRDKPELGGTEAVFGI